MQSESEWQTRKNRIDSKLDPAWKIVRYKEGMNLSRLDCHAVEEFPTANGPADYALFVEGRLLGIIEAKKVTVNPQNVMEQAKRYAAGAEGIGNWDGLRVPFLYATNGELIWFLDVRSEKHISRKISGFHTPKALAEFIGSDAGNAHEWLRSNSPDQIERLRQYQKNAIGRIESAIISGIREISIFLSKCWVIRNPTSAAGPS
jgi:type I restriction enzyme, R subunit